MKSAVINFAVTREARKEMADIMAGPSSLQVIKVRLTLDDLRMVVSELEKVDDGYDVIFDGTPR